MQKPFLFSSHRLLGLSLAAGAAAMLVATPASADVELAPLVVIDFSEFDASGFGPEPDAGQLDSDDWSIDLGNALLDFGEEAGGAGSDFARGVSTGDVDDPGIWAFDVDGAGLIALGVQPSDQVFTPGRMILRLVNNTGADVAEFQVEYTVWVNNNNPRSNSFDLEHSPDNIDYTQVGDPFASPGEADDSGFTGTDQEIVVTPDAAIADGEQYYISWFGDDEDGGTMERDEFGVEGITIRLLNACGNGLVEGDEECDDGLDNEDTGACTTACTAAACGDGFMQDGEECDDGNTDDGDGCAADCTTEGGDTDTDSGGETDTDSGSGESSDSASASASGTASMTDATATSPTTTSPSSGSDTDGGDGGEDDDTGGCVCRASGGGAPVFGMLGFLVLGLLRRRR